MTNLRKNDISKYPSNILKTFSEASLYHFARQAIIEQDYASLKHVMKSVNEDLLKEKHFLVNYNALQRAIEELDVKAVKIILEEISDLSILTNNRMSFGKELVKDNDIKKWIHIEDYESKRKEILKLYLEFMPKEGITMEILQFLSEVLSKKNFENFYKIKGINLKDETFKDLNLKHYEAEDYPLLKLNSNNQNVTNILLSKTYSKDMTFEQVNKIYHKLYNLHPISNEMLKYSAHLISENNDIKIIFADNVTSSYHHLSNKIFIDTNFLKEPIFNIESVVIHELGHFVYKQIFDFEAAPFNITPLKTIKSNFYYKHKDYMNDSYVQNILSDELTDDLEYVKYN